MGRRAARTWESVRKTVHPSSSKARTVAAGSVPGEGSTRVAPAVSAASAPAVGQGVSIRRQRSDNLRMR